MNLLKGIFQENHVLNYELFCCYGYFRLFPICFCRVTNSFVKSLSDMEISFFDKHIILNKIRPHPSKLLISLRFLGLKVAYFLKVFGGGKLLRFSRFSGLKDVYIFSRFLGFKVAYIFKAFWVSKWLIFSKVLALKVAYFFKVFWAESCLYFQDFWGSELLSLSNLFAAQSCFYF